MFGDGALTFREFSMNEPLPLATIHGAVLQFLRGRDDVALFGAQAVNAWVDEPRMTQDVDILSTRAKDFSDELQTHLNERFHIAIWIREVRNRVGYRVYQVRKPKNRHLVDVRSVEQLPDTEEIDGVAVLPVPQLICDKLISMVNRAQTAKGLTDGADLRRLLLAFPEPKSETGPVAACLGAANATDAAFEAWQDLVAEEIFEENEDDKFLL